MDGSLTAAIAAILDAQLGREVTRSPYVIAPREAETSPRRLFSRTPREKTMRYALLWLLGVPIPILIIIALMFR